MAIVKISQHTLSLIKLSVIIVNWLQVLCRVLRQGKFISITFAQPHFRKPFFLDKSFTWSLDCQSFGETFHYFVYTLEKGKRTDFGESKRQSISTVKMESPMHEHMDQENYLSYISLWSRKRGGCSALWLMYTQVSKPLSSHILVEDISSPPSYHICCLTTLVLDGRLKINCWA